MSFTNSSKDKVDIIFIFLKFLKLLLMEINTGKSLSEALIFASINPQYDSRFFMELP